LKPTDKQGSSRKDDAAAKPPYSPLELKKLSPKDALKWLESPGQPFSLLATWSVLLVQRKLSLKELNEHLGETEPGDDRKNNGEHFNPVYHSRHRTALCGGL
jgi:hypothetical protein